MSADKSIAFGDGSIAPDIAEYERQFREILEHCLTTGERGLDFSGPRC